MKWEDRFKQRIVKLEHRIANVKKRQDFIFNIRMAIALGIFGVLVFAVMFPNLKLELPTILVGFIMFAYFVIISSRLNLYKSKLSLLLGFYSRMRARVQNTQDSHDYLNSLEWLVQTPKFQSEDAEQLSRDIDIFGQNSLWSSLSECFSYSGREYLSQSLLSPKLNLEFIKSKQSRLVLAADYTGFLRKFTILGFLGQNEFKDIPLLQSEVAKTNYSKKNEVIYFILIALWLLAITESVLDVASQQHNIPAYFRFVFPFASILALRGLGDLYGRAQTLSSLFSKLKTVFEHLGRLDVKVKPTLLPRFTNTNPLNDIKAFDRNLSFLTVNSHPLVMLTLNFISPWNYHFSRQLEKNRRRLQQSLPQILDEMGEFEELSSFAFLKKYRATTLPNFSKTPHIDALELSHPLADLNFVKNDFKFHDEKLVLLTGSNMSGKSTFMRTLGANHILATAGAPVFAKQFTTYVGPLISCIRVSDSLREGASYFYAEVKRLKQIIDASIKEPPILYLVDEIFKGTNNKERFLGSRELILYLSQTSSLGLISTHDLELAVLESERIKNWHFTDSIEDGQLRFSYKIQQGPSPSTNALKIMQIEGLPVPKQW